MAFELDRKLGQGEWLGEDVHDPLGCRDGDLIVEVVGHERDGGFVIQGFRRHEIDEEFFRFVGLEPGIDEDVLESLVREFFESFAHTSRENNAVALR